MFAQQCHQPKVAPAAKHYAQQKTAKFVSIASPLSMRNAIPASHLPAHGEVPVAVVDNNTTIAALLGGPRQAQFKVFKLSAGKGLIKALLLLPMQLPLLCLRVFHDARFNISPQPPWVLCSQ